MSVEVDAPAQALRLHAHLPDAQAVMSLLMLSDALRRAYPGRPLALHLPYVPYARQDRVANPGEALSAKVFCQLINAQGYSRVVIQDPHSDVVTALLDRVEVEDPLPALRRVLEQVGPAALVAPDAGARKRVLKLARELGCEAVLADKVRDTQSGRISGTQVTGPCRRCRYWWWTISATAAALSPSWPRRCALASGSRAWTRRCTCM